MGNEVVILLVVGIAAAGIAYFSNMLCQPMKLCYPPGGVETLPLEPPSIEGTPLEDIEAAKPLLSAYPEAIAKTIGGTLSKLPPIGVPPINLTSRFTPGGRLTPALRTKACKASMGPSYCWSEGAGACIKCHGTAGANFAESQGYYVRTA